MPYVTRGPDGSIQSVLGTEHVEGAEFLPLNTPELIAFLGGNPVGLDANPFHDLALSDLVMIRVLEDLIDVLVAKGVILATDLPEVAQRKLRQRAHMRHRAGGRLSLSMPEGDQEVL